MIKPPAFWQNKNNDQHLLSALLRPASALYAWAGRRKFATIVPYKSAGPVICIGNITMGGVGKTPFTQMVAKALSQQGTQARCVDARLWGTRKRPVSGAGKPYGA